MSTHDLSEDQRVELWHMAGFLRQGFDGMQIAALLAWGISPHDTEALLYRDDQRTACSHEQALRILMPDWGAVLV